MNPETRQSLLNVLTQAWAKSTEFNENDNHILMSELEHIIQKELGEKLDVDRILSERAET
jgi:hypothetical protein